MHFRLSLYRWSEILFRAGLAVVFAYFGILALINPEETAARFMDPRVYEFVRTVMPITYVMMAFGLAQIAVAAGILSRVFFKVALAIAALMLLGIIVNLGIVAPGESFSLNELALRDIAILTAIIYLLIHG